MGASSSFDSYFNNDSPFGVDSTFGLDRKPFGQNSTYENENLYGMNFSRTRNPDPGFERTDNSYIRYNKAIDYEHRVYEDMKRGKATFGDYLEACQIRNSENLRYHKGY